MTERRVFETESRKGELKRGDLARAVIEAGWDLNEMRPEAMSLEEIFLRLTGSEATTEPEAQLAEEPHEEAAAEPEIEAAEEEPQG